MLGVSCVAPLRAIPGRGAAVQEPGQGEPFPAAGRCESRERAFPGAESRRMDPLAADGRRHRLTMMAVLVMQHVLDEYGCDPGQGEPRRDLNAAALSAVASEPQVGQAAPGRLPSPTDRHRRQIGEPGRVDSFRERGQEGLRIGAHRVESRCPIRRGGGGAMGYAR